MATLSGEPEYTHVNAYGGVYGCNYGRVDFFVGVGPDATWLGSGDGAWSTSDRDDGELVPTTAKRSYGRGGLAWWIQTLEQVAERKAFYRQSTFEADVAGWLADTHNVGRKTAAPTDRGYVRILPHGGSDVWPWFEDRRAVELDHRSAGTAFAWVPFDAASWAVAKDAALQMAYDGADVAGHPAREARIRQIIELFAQGGVHHEPELVDKVDSLFWRYVDGGIAEPPPGRVLISRAGNEWHSLAYEIRFEVARIHRDDPYDYAMDLRRLEDDEVVDLWTYPTTKRKDRT